MSDRDDVLDAFDAVFTAALESRDADAFMDAFVDDDSIRWWGSTSAEQLTGRERLRDHAERITQLDGTLGFTWTERTVNVEGDVAWVAGLGAYDAFVEGQHLSGEYRITAVLVRRDGAWKWHTYHGSEPAD